MVASWTTPNVPSVLTVVPADGGGVDDGAAVVSTVVVPVDDAHGRSTDAEFDTELVDSMSCASARASRKQRAPQWIACGINMTNVAWGKGGDNDFSP